MSRSGKSISVLLCMIVLLFVGLGAGVDASAAETVPEARGATSNVEFGVGINSWLIPDAAFRSYVSSNVDKDSDGTLTAAEVEAVTSIDVGGDGIRSLQGIDMFVNLRTLNCMNNQLTSLDLSGNAALETLYCDNNQLTSLNVRGNPALETLTCHFNQLTVLDLSQNTELDYLGCESNRLTNLDFSNTKLTQTSTTTMGSSYVISSPFDLSTLPGSFDISKASDWSRGTINGTILTASEGEVTYRYDCGNNCKKSFTLVVESAAPSTYTISYDTNGGTGAPPSQTKAHGVTVVLSTTKPTRTGYSFQGWAETKNATSAKYSAGSSYTSNKTVTLYAVWKANTYTISYDANGGSGAPSSQTKTYGVTLTLSTIKPTRTGYSFQGWAGSKTATSAKYQAGGSYTANGNVTLYAVWKANTYTISYNANGGSGAPAAQTKTHDVTLTLSIQKPTRNGYNFMGWAETSTATSAKYNAGASYTANSSATLYAVWKPGDYVISFDANGGTGAPNSQIKTHGATLTLPTTKPSRTGYSFLGWAESKTATSAKYQAGGSYTANGNATLYAVWKANTYTISYDANGGTGAPSAQTKTHGSALKLSTQKPVKSGSEFVGWALDKWATAADYAAGAQFEINQNVVLYAVWKKNAVEMDFDVRTDAYSFGNTRYAFGYTSVGPGSSYPIGYETFKIIFGDTVAAKSKYKQTIISSWGGNCCGMSSTSALFYDGNMTSASFGRSDVVSLDLNDSNGTINIKTFIEAMQIAQYTEQFAQHYKGNRVFKYQINNGSRSLNQMYDVVKAELSQGQGTIIAIGKTDVGAHAMMAYKLETVSENEIRMYVYDCNFPGQTRYFTLNVDANKKVVGWTYDMGGYGVWGTEGADSAACYISYIPYETIEYIWEHRGHLFDNNEMLSFNGENLSIFDFEGKEVAKIVGGQLQTSRSDIYEMPELSMVWKETKSIFLPKDFYTIVSNDGEALELSMVDGNLGATVRTTTPVVSFAVDNSTRENTVIVENASMEDSYQVELESSFSGVRYQNVVISGTGKGESISISNDMDTLAIANCNIESLRVNGVEQVTYLITSYAGEGGSISPVGDTRIKADGSQQYTITPDDGYTIDRVLVDGINVGAIKEYTFQNVLKDHTIVAYFRKANDISGVIFDSVACCATASVSNQQSVRMVCALYSNDGQMLWTTTKVIPAASSSVQFDIPESAVSEWSTMKIMMLDSAWIPLCDSCILKK